jgi:hypothetical protein
MQVFTMSETALRQLVYQAASKAAHLCGRGHSAMGAANAATYEAMDYARANLTNGLAAEQTTAERQPAAGA